MKKYSADEVRTLLRSKAIEAGSQRKLAKQMGCSAAFITDVLKGKREPTGPVLAYLGLRRDVLHEISYRRV